MKKFAVAQSSLLWKKPTVASFQLTTRNLNIPRCALYTNQIEASTSPPPRAYPAHLTPFPAREGGNLITTHRGGEFDH